MERRTLTRACAAGGSLVAAALLAACGGGAAASSAATSAAPLSTASSSAPSSPSASASADPSSTAASSASSSASASGTAAVRAVAPLTPAADLRLRGTAGSAGSLDYDVTVPAFAKTGAGAEVDRRIEASVRSAVTAAAAEDDTDSHHTLEGSGAVTTDDGRTVQVVISLDDSYDGAAHPTGVVNTVALVAATGAPITLGQLFTDQRSALTTMGEQVSARAAAAGEDVTEPDGLAATAENWSAWQTSADGVEFEFQDYQLGGHGVRSYVVPWSVAAPLLTRTAKALLAPTS